MASSCSGSIFASSTSVKIIPYVPQASKPKSKPTSKSKSAVSAKSTEYGSSGVSLSEYRDARECNQHKDLPKSGSNASCPRELGVPALFGVSGVSGSPEHDTAGSLVELEKSQYHQPGWKSLDGDDAEHTPSIEKTYLALDELFDENSRASPPNLAADSVEAHNNAAKVQPGNGSSDPQTNAHAVADTSRDRAGQHINLDLTSTHAAVSPTEPICTPSKKPSSAKDDSTFGANLRTKSPSTHKRSHSSLHDTAVPPAEVVDITSGSEQDDPYSTKRRRSSERQAEDLVLNNIPTSKPLLPLLSSPGSPLRTDNELSPGLLDNDTQGSSARGLVTSQNELSQDNSDDSPHPQRIAKALHHSTRWSISPFERTEGGKTREYDDDEADESDDELSWTDKPFYRNAAGNSRQRKGSGSLAQRKTRDPLQTAARPRDPRTMPTKASGQVTTSRARQSCFPQRFLSGTHASDGPNNKHRASTSAAYQIRDLTFCHVPKGSVVTAVVHCSEPDWSPNLTRIKDELLGDKSKLIRTMQISPDLWMMFGYRYDGSVSGSCTHESQKLFPADWTSDLCYEAASYSSEHLEDAEEEDESSGEGMGEYRPHPSGSGQRFSKDDMRCRRRTHRPWLESEEERLLSYKDRMGMDWDQIISRFPGRTSGAVKLRYYTLRKKDS